MRNWSTTVGLFCIGPKTLVEGVVVLVEAMNADVLVILELNILRELNGLVNWGQSIGGLSQETSTIGFA